MNVATKPAETYPADWSETPGIYDDIPEDIYHADRQAVSKSQLDKLERSPLHFRHALDNPDDSETPTLRVGRALHSLVLDGREAYEARFATRPTFSGTGSVKARAAWNAEHLGMTILTEAERDQVEGMAAAIQDMPLYQFVMDAPDAVAEQTIVWRDDAENRERVVAMLSDIPSDDLLEPTDILCRCRVDLASKERGIWLDLKSTANAQPRAWSRSLWDYRYHVQAPFYSDGGLAHGFVCDHWAFLVSEKTPPYAPAPYRLVESAIERGRLEYLRNLATLKQCQDAGHWPSYCDTVTDIDLPPWGYSDLT